jgi:hypothetical protein
MLFWLIVGVLVLAMVFCTVVAIAMIRATRPDDFD